MIEIRLLLAAILLLAILTAARPSMAIAKDSGYIQIQNIRQPDSGAAQIISGQISIPDGEYFCNIRHPAKSRAVLQTRFVQIRATEATIILQTGDSACRIAVLQGKASLRNIFDRSIIELGSGEVYETVATSGSYDVATTATSAQSSDSVIATPYSLACPGTRLPVFQTTKFSTSLFVLDPSSVQQLNCAPARATASLHTADQRARVVSPPTACNYQVGKDIPKRLPLPAEMVMHFPPSGIIPDSANNSKVAEASPGT